MSCFNDTFFTVLPSDQSLHLILVLSLKSFSPTAWSTWACGGKFFSRNGEKQICFPFILTPLINQTLSILKSSPSGTSDNGFNILFFPVIVQVTRTPSVIGVVQSQPFICRPRWFSLQFFHPIKCSHNPFDLEHDKHPFL